MKNDKKWLLWGLIGFTLILLLTAVVLFIQLKKPAAPLPTPQPKPVASPKMPAVKEVGGEGVCELSFTVSASPSPSPSPSPQLTVCFDKCEADNDCQTSLRCLTVAGDKRCVNPNCSEDIDCQCPGEKKSCFDKCENDNDCADSRKCMTIPGTNDRRCINPICITDSDCSCDQTQASPSPSPSPRTITTYASPSPTVAAQTKGGQPVLPVAGNLTPAVLGVSAGLGLILWALLLL